MSSLLELYLQLMQERDEFICQPEFLLADMVLLSFVNDILESVQAAMGVLDLKNIPHKAFSCVRVAFEAAQQGMVLVTQDDYAFAGAKAWIYFCRRDKDWLALAKPEGSGIADKDDAARWFEERLIEIATVWESVSTGKRELLNKARSELDKQSRRPDNWLGKDFALEQDHAYRKVALHRQAEITDSMSSTNRAIYGSLSRDSHTGMRINSQVEFHVNGNGVNVVFSARDNHYNFKTVSTSALIAVSEILMSLDYRKNRQ